MQLQQTGTTMFAPEFATDAKDGPTARIEPCPPFMLKCHPQRWSVQGGRILPEPAKLKLRGGIGGVELVDGAKGQPGKLKVRAAIAATEEQGWRVVPFDVDGAGTNYLAKVDGVEAYVTKWETVYPGSAATTRDDASYFDWLDSLIARKVIAPVGRDVLERMEADCTKLLATAQETARTVPEARERVDRYSADLKVIRAAMGKAPAVVGKAAKTSAAKIEVE
jgi:hypothetical protein